MSMDKDIEAALESRLSVTMSQPSPSPSRRSSSSLGSKTTAHDLSHAASTTQHSTNDHDHSEKNNNVVYIPDEALDRKDPHFCHPASSETLAESTIRIQSLTALSRTQEQMHGGHGHPLGQDGCAGGGKEGGDSTMEGRPLPDDLKIDGCEGRICGWADIPPWMRDNPAILTGYRRPTFSYRKSLESLGYLHNESVNIWSHLLGAVAFIVLLPTSYFKVIGVLDTIQWTDIAVFYAFLAGAIICLSMSASFHTVCCHSEMVSGQWNRCDYVGIVFLIVGSFYPAIFYGFYCHKTWQIMYISLISIFGAATIFVVLQPKFRTPQFRWVRSGLFLAMGLSGLFPIVHGIILYGFPMAQRAVALNYMFCMGAAYVLGAFIYGSRFPECLFPGKFDHFMSSHQIFHFCVLIGCVVHFLGVTRAMEFWHSANHSCTIPLAQMQAEFLH